MAIQAVAAQVLAAVTRARLLFASAPEPLPTGQSLESAAQSTVGAGQRAAELSGVLVERHGDFVGAQARHLSTAGRTDTTLASQLSIAATLTQSGAHQLDAIVEQTRALAQAAPYARSPADQRTLLAALQTQLSQANAVVSTTRQQASAIAGQIRGLTYETGAGHVYAAGFGPGGAPQDTPKRPPSPQPAPPPAPSPNLPPPLQDFENQLRGLPPIPTSHPRVSVDDIRRYLQEQHDEYLEQLIRDAQQKPACTTDDIARALAELAGAGTSAIGGAVTSETGVGLYLGIAGALISGGLAIDDFRKCLP